MNIKLSDIAEAVDGELRGGDPCSEAASVSVDSRSIKPLEAFFALKGPNFDGHRFVKDVFSKGAVCAVVERSSGLDAQSGAVIAVDDTLCALGRLASYVRGLYNTPLVAISGTAGKTTTKEMTASILGRSRRVLKTEGNKNNLVGLPLTLFGLDGAIDAAVVELGISEPWEMERLVGICSPDVALITNIGRGHLKTLGSLEGVAKAKGALFERLGPDGVKAVNLDDPWVVRISGIEATGAVNVITYSAVKDADVRVKEYEALLGLEGAEATYDVRGEKVTVRLRAPGAANVLNGVAAAAASLALGASAMDIEAGLNSFIPAHGRMEALRVNGLTILDDSYNANPESVACALKTLQSAPGRKIAVIGDMLELGDASAGSHREIGSLAARLPVDILVAVGDWSKETAGAARAEGLEEESVYAFKDKKEAAGALKGMLKKGDTVLVKGSRAVGLETIVDGLKAGPESALAQ